MKPYVLSPRGKAPPKVNARVRKCRAKVGEVGGRIKSLNAGLDLTMKGVKRNDITCDITLG